MDLDGFVWICMDLDGNIWKSTKINENAAGRAGKSRMEWIEWNGTGRAPSLLLSFFLLSLGPSLLSSVFSGRLQACGRLGFS